MSLSSILCCNQITKKEARVDRNVKFDSLGVGVRISYDLSLRYSDIDIKEVIIDQYYTKKHFDMSDWIILELVKTLHNKTYEVKAMNGKFKYFATEPLFHNHKPYRLIFLLEKNCYYIGVINAFRISEKKYGIPN